jgi:hypothetical protein
VRRHRQRSGLVELGSGTIVTIVTIDALGEHSWLSSSGQLPQ